MSMDKHFASRLISVNPFMSASFRSDSTIQSFPLWRNTGANETRERDSVCVSVCERVGNVQRTFVRRLREWLCST